MHTVKFVAAIFVTGLTGCTAMGGGGPTASGGNTTAGAAGSPSGAAGGGLHNTALVFIEPAQATKKLGQYRPASITDPNENKVIELCKQGQAPSAVAPLLMILGTVVGDVITWGVNEIDTSLQNALKEYTATYSASQTVEIYSSVNGGVPAMGYTCFRMSRGDKTGGKNEVHFDFVGQVRLGPNGDSLQIRPLRLFMDSSETKSKSSNGQYGVALSIKADSFWRDHNLGKESVVFDKGILTAKVNLKTGTPWLQYYLDDDRKWVTLPVIPFSDPLQPGATTTGTSAMTMTVVENGVPPALLAAVSKLFSGSKSQLEKSLTSSADAALGVPASSTDAGSTATPKPSSNE